MEIDNSEIKVKMKKALFSLFVTVMFSSLSCTNPAGEMKTLKDGFENPPQEARAQVWWHWMNGNITKEGIKADLEWMQRIGLGGFHHFDAALSTPTVVDKRLIYMDEGWKDAFSYATRLADSLGLEMTVASAPGWSSTGGPWVEPKDAMKKLVWRECSFEGGKTVAVKLPEPYRTTGAILNGPAAGRGQAATAQEYYEDIATLAVRIPEGNKDMTELGVKVTSSGGHFTAAMLCDQDIATSSELPYGPDGTAWIKFEFPQPQTIRSISSSGLSGARLECSADGKNYVKLCDLVGGRTSLSTITVPETTSRYFKVVIKSAPAGGMSFWGGNSAPRTGVQVSELALYPYTRINRAEDKAAFSASAKLASVPTPVSEGEVFPSLDDVVDVSSFVDKDGVLNWNAPQGKWKIYRFGWSLTGKQNHPAPPEATGLEVDKLDPVAWKKYFEAYLDMYKEASGSLMGQKGLQYVLTDSYEAEHQTWTPAMLEEFRTRRGYDMLKWMPALAGEVISSPEESDKFLWDWRINISDLYAANYDLLTQIAQQEYGMKGRYSESHEAGRAFMGDGMDAKRTAQIPMGAMWSAAPWLGRTPDGDYDRGVYVADDRESASVAHIYGQNIAAAESMTSMGGRVLTYSYCPENLKYVADLEFASGINRIVVHESAHQPVDDKVPGLSLGGIGQWFHRHETWAEMADAWAMYLARTSFLLQAGKNVADILYYYGEDSSVCSEFRRNPDIPAGYEWDYCSPNALLDAISVKNGKLISEGGTEYKMLVMDRNVEYMSLEVLRKIARIADEGVVICAAKPRVAASLSDSQEEFDALVADIFESGRKNVYVGESVASVLDKASIEADVIYSDEGMVHRHRSLPNTQIYWINKPSKSNLTTEVSFRVNGLRPEIWHADSGLIEPASYRMEGGRTIVTLNLVPDDAVFVVFNGKADKSSLTLPKPAYTTLLSMDHNWKVSFQEGRGAPESAEFEKLISFTESSDKGIRYFSGVAEYSKTISIPQHGESSLVLDLGCTRNIAQVYVNGEFCGTAWKEPFRVDITKAAVEGENLVQVKVANLWVNRLIGDEQPDCTERITYIDAPAYTAQDPLQPSGLLGPVKLLKKD